MEYEQYGIDRRERTFHRRKYPDDRSVSGILYRTDVFPDDPSAEKAAVKAGYRYPKASAEDNRRKPACKAYIDKRMKPKDKRRIADADEVLDYLSGVMRGEIKDQFGLDASLQDRTKAAQELLKRYAVADQRQQSTMQRLDAILMTFNAALQETPTAPEPTAPTAPTAPATGPEASGNVSGDA